MPDITVAELDELVKKVFTQKAEVEALESKVNEASKKLTELQSSLLSCLQDLKKDNYSVKDFGEVVVQKRFSVRTPKTAEDKSMFLKYLQEKGIFWDMVTVNSNTLNAFYRSEMEEAKKDGNLNFKVPGIGDPSYFEYIKLKK